MKKYTNFIKCTFISKTHSIFEFTILEDFKTVICEGNIIVDAKIECNMDTLKRKKNVNIPNDELLKAIERCKSRAKWIYNNN